MSAMAESPTIAQREPGAPIAPGEIDPDLVKLARSRPRIGIITAAGLVVLCLMFLLRIGDDRRFGCAGAQPATVTVGDIVAGKVDTEQLVTVAAEPLVSQAIRAAKNVGNMGLRVAPVRGTAERLWIVAPGDGWQPAAMAGYTGRLRRLDTLAFAAAIRRYAAEHPRPVFAAAAAVHAGLASGAVMTVAGDQVMPSGADRVGLDTVDPGACTIAASFTDRLPDTTAWTAALATAGIHPTGTAAPDVALGQVRFTVAAPVATVAAALETATLWGARVEPVTRHVETTWAALHKSPPAALDFATKLLPDGQIDLVGLYISRAIPDDAYAVVTGELPDDYWYVLPIAITLVVILLLFSWALARAVRRDLVAVRTG